MEKEITILSEKIAEISPLREIERGYQLKLKNEKSKYLIDKLLNQKEVSRHFSGFKKHHEDSAIHCYRTGLIAIDIGIENLLDDYQLSLLGKGAVLHDLGKCEILDEILSGTRKKLTEEKRKIIEAHPSLGFEQLTGEEFEEVRKIVISHHEYKNGPYPRKEDRRKLRGGCSQTNELKDEKRSGRETRKLNPVIDRLTQIVAVADMFDALASYRSYKKSFSIDKTKDLLKKEFTGDPQLITQVLERWGG